MSWSYYFLNGPAFCTPLPVMRGLVSALCERREAVDSVFHAACVSSGVSAVVENRLANILFCGTTDEILFKEIRKESGSFIPQGNSSGRYSFMHMFDAFLMETLEGFSQTAGYAYRFFTDSAGTTAYDTLESLASALSEQLITAHSVNSSAVAADRNYQVCLNAAWAAQRTGMMKLLRYVKVGNGGFTMQCATADEHGYGPTPQSAYSGIGSWTSDNIGFAGWETPLECRVEYHYNAWAVPEEHWAVDSAWKVTAMTPVFDGCLETQAGQLKFDAVDLREEDGPGNNEEDEDCVCLFDPLGTPVSSGANTFALNSGSVSWENGAVNIGSTGDEEKTTIKGWQARNVQIVFDYESVFNFKQEE